MAFKFRHKVLLALCAAVLLALGTFLGITLWRLQSSAEMRVRQGLENAKDAFYRARQNQGEAVADAVKSLASNNPELRAALANRGGGEDPFAGASGGDDELQTLESSMPDLPLYQKADQFVVRDRNGKVLLAKDKDTLPAETNGPPLVAIEALASKQSYDWWPGKNSGTLQVFAGSVLLGEEGAEEAVGTITVGYTIDRRFLDPLAKISQTTIDLAGIGDAPAPEGVRVAERSGARFLESTVPITAPSGRKVGSFLVSRSLDEELRDATALRNQLLLLGMVVLLVAAGLALYLANLVSRPLEALGRAVREVGAGNFSFRLKSRATDEFGTLGNLIDEMAAGLEERERIRATFSRYVDDEVVAEVLKHQGAAALEGDERTISVLFADLANFTRFSEGKSPKELLRDLNGYFAAMAKVIDEQHGILDKFIGDAIMAYWGAPVPNARHAELACRTALAQAKRFRDEFLPAYPGLGLRIGISTGNALVGNVGSERRQNYTVMGDTVNLASRLEGVNKTFGTTICLPRETRAGLEELFQFRLLGRVKVAGRSEAEPVYELLGERGDSAQAELARKYEHGLSLFEEGDFPAAADLLEPLALGGDGPAKALFERCRERRRHDRRDGSWDGAWVLSK